MTDMPETIWLLPGAGDEGSTVWCDDPAPGAEMDPNDATEYVRADLARASLAAAYEAAATTATSIVAACNWTEDAERNDVLAEGALAAQSHCAYAIRALTPADDRAALDRLLAEARAQEREAARKLLEEMAATEERWSSISRTSGAPADVERYAFARDRLKSAARQVAAIRARGEAATSQEGDA